VLLHDSIFVSLDGLFERYCIMASLADRMQSLRPALADILEASGSPGLSLGVLHHGQTVHTAHFGRRNIDEPHSPNDDTIYHVASLTKLITAAAVASLVHDGVLDWNLPVRHYLPDFQRGDELGQKCTLIDLLSHRSGIAMADGLWGQQLGEFLIPKSEIVHTACHLEAVKPFRSSFFYSQWNYALVTEIVERVTGQSFGTYVHEKILQPLSMQRTSFMREEGENTSLPYAVDDDLTPHRLPSLNMTDETGFAGAMAARSSIKDLLSLYRSLLLAFQHQCEHDTHSTEGSPFVQVRSILSPYSEVGSHPIDEVAYCLGLYRTRLPNNLGVASINNLILGPRRMPRIGTRSPGLKVYHHTGNVPGYFASAFLIPSTESVVVVLTNSFPFMDPTDFIGQLLVSHLLGEEPPRNQLELCKLGQARLRAGYAALASQLEQAKTTQPPQFRLDAYEGDYFNAAGNFFLSIVQRGEGLLMTVQNMPLTQYQLLPYGGNTFYWPADRNAEIKVCIWPNFSPGRHKVTFGATGKDTVDRLIWQHDPFGKAEVFSKRYVSGKLQRGKL
jgi:CubicO group peptidase (beta-lactamase class C family)